MNHKHITYGLTGIWNSLGCPPESGQGISLYLEDSDSQDESLIDLCKFTVEKKDIGIVADSKLISELVVLLPMVKPGSPIPTIPISVTEISASVEVKICPACSDNPCGHPVITTGYNNKVYKPRQSPGFSFVPYSSYWNNTAVTYTYPVDRYYAETNLPGPFDGYGVNYEYLYSEEEVTQVDPTLQTEKKQTDVKKYLELIKSDKENAYLFQINEDVVNNILSTIDYKKLTILQIKEILDNKLNLDSNNNVVKLMRMMVKYNFPPHLNWLLFKNLPRYAMYVEEFSYILSKEDLSSIWQGTMPDIAKNPIEDREHVIEHFLTNDEIFGGYDINELDIKLKIFKVKLRAKNSYEKDIKNLSSVKDSVKDSEQEKVKWYQFNWPYDNFSLVELLKIDAGEVRDYNAEFQVSGSNSNIKYNTSS